MLNPRFHTAVLAVITLSAILTTAAVAAPPKTAKPTKKDSTTYECSKCHMKVTAAMAKKDKFKDPMDGGKFVPTKKTTTPAGKMGKMKM